MPPAPDIRREGETANSLKFYLISHPLFKSQQNWSFMSIALTAKRIGISAFAGLGMPALLGSARADTPMTAGVIMEKMEARERGGYFIGIIEGFAYARFRKDSAEAGSKVETGMQCIYDFFYADVKAGIQRIEAAFRNYPEHMPSTLIAALLKKECGE